MKKQDGINGQWVSVKPGEQLSQTVIATLVTLGTPAVIQIAISVSASPDDSSWLLALVFWVYGLLFWVNSTGANLFRTRRWEWSAEALAEQRRYLSDARLQSQAFWAHWWVRFPIGIVFLATGLQALISGDFSLQLMSFVLLLSAFVTPFVFMAELALLPLCLGLSMGLIAVVTMLPVIVAVLLCTLLLVVTIMMVKNRRATLQRASITDQPRLEAKETKADSAAPPEPEANAAGTEETPQDAK